MQKYNNSSQTQNKTTFLTTKRALRLKRFEGSKNYKNVLILIENGKIVLYVGFRIQRLQYHLSFLHGLCLVILLYQLRVFFRRSFVCAVHIQDIYAVKSPYGFLQTCFSVCGKASYNSHFRTGRSKVGT